MVILAVCNQKGGVGKTTTAVNLAASLAGAGHDTLLVDLDPQGNASTSLGVPYDRRAPGVYHALMSNAGLASAVGPTAIPNLAILPADADLAGAEVDLAGAADRGIRLKRALAESMARMIIVDCPPSLGLLTLNGLVAADRVVLPLQCEFFALEGLAHMTRTIERVRRTLNARLAIEGILLTMHDSRNNLSDLVAADVRATFGPLVFETVIPRNVRVSEAPSHGRPVVLYDPKSAGAQAYQAFAAELTRRLGHGP